MFIKKSAVLRCENNPRSLLAADVVLRDGTAEIICAGERAAVCHDGHVFSLNLSDGRCKFNHTKAGEFEFGIIRGGEIFICDNAVSNGAIKRCLKEGAIRKENVNIAYDDEAIAQENYFIKERGINPTWGEITREKGDFLNLQTNIQRQYSTGYPQNVESVKEVNNNAENCVYTEDEDGGSKAQDRTKTGESESGNCQNPRGEGSEGESNFKAKNRRTLDGIDALLNAYPRVKGLEFALDGSKFVKINYAHDKFYVVGKTVVKGEDEYIIFGVPATLEMPKELSGKAWFVPTSTGENYFLMYQSAQTGKLLLNPNKK